MGIDKSNVRYVIHYNMPQSMENYYQEAGRAGRDGESAQCILLFSAQDVIIDKFLLSHKEMNEIDPADRDLVRQRDAERLQIMEGYCRTSECLRNYILAYFGEKRTQPCDNCGNCHREFSEVDMTEDAKQVINCVWEMRGRYGLGILLGTLLGANRARLKELGTTEYKTYGVLKDRPEAQLRLLISQLIMEGYLQQTADKYTVIRLGNIAPLKDPDTRVLVRFHKDREPERRDAGRNSRNKRSTDALTKAGYEQFDELRSLRLTIAREEGMPPYIVFSDRTLADMSAKAPCDKASMLRVSGVGEAKYEKYGSRFIQAVTEFLETHPDCVTSLAVQEDGPENGTGAGPEETGCRNRDSCLQEKRLSLQRSS
jgi:ATP-dependent DNA helicase RecQ